MKKLYYPLWYRLDSKDRYLIWYRVADANEDLDGVVLDKDGKIPTFNSPEALSIYAEAEGISLENETPARHNLDVVALWLANWRPYPKRPAVIFCDEFLSAWNLFGDVARSVGALFETDRAQTDFIYQKLFWGSNLPALTPPGKRYVPLWTKREKATMRELLRKGLLTFRAAVPTG